jgi:iron complex outermembrane receptor protein
MRQWKRQVVVAMASIAVGGGSSSAQQTAAPDISLDSLLNTRIRAASKYEQTSASAPGSVTIVTSEDIHLHGYRNLQEILENVRGFYVSNDRNYPYLGARGFGRPADYNNRILLLIDGHALNEQVFGGVPVGSDLPLNLDAVERVEVVQGPGSALFGTSAMFAVINIVTKTSTALDGGSVRAGVGSAGERTASAVAGHALGARGSISGSALITRTAGLDQYYAEYDRPETSNGIARGADWERAGSAIGSLAWGDVGVHAGFRSRAKGIPTGQYDVLFGDPRARTDDKSLWGDVSLRHQWSGSLSASAKLYATRTQYRGVYPFVVGETPDQDFEDNVSIGMDNMLMWEPSSRDRLTVGSEITRISRAAYASRLGDGMETRDDTPYTVVSAFAQNELQLFTSASLVAGMRVDHYSTFGSAAMPRVALLLTPDAATTVKLLYGEAFRAPSSAEALMTVGSYTANPDLEPERIRTAEIDMKRRLAAPVLLGLSLYRYRVENLIDQVPLGPTVTRYENVSGAIGKGAEAQLDLRPSGPVGLRLSYALQHTADERGVTLENSPEQVGNLDLTGHFLSGAHGSVQIRHESGRRTLAGTSTPAFTRVDTNVGYALSSARLRARIGSPEVALRVTNLFGARYATPTGPGNRQSSIAADGRVLALRVDWRR